MMKLIIITVSNNIIYGRITKDNKKNICYDVLASDNIYNKKRKYINNCMNNTDIDNLIEKFKNMVYFASVDGYKFEKVKNITISKKKLFIMDTISNIFY